LGVFGAGVLYWETVASDQDLQSVGKEIARAGSSTKLTFWDCVSVITFAELGVVMFFLYSTYLVLLAKQNANQGGLHTALQLGVVAVVYACPAFFVYVQMKLTRRLCSRWRQRFWVSQKDAGKAEIKRILRLIGFASLYLAGMAQLPAILFSPH
jgi:hypothetical protein